MATKEDVIKYVMDTPGNTNKAVLNSILNNLSDGDSKDNPFEIIGTASYINEDGTDNLVFYSSSSKYYYGVPVDVDLDLDPEDTTQYVVCVLSVDNDSKNIQFAGPAFYTLDQYSWRFTKDRFMASSGAQTGSYGLKIRDTDQVRHDLIIFPPGQSGESSVESARYAWTNNGNKRIYSNSKIYILMDKTAILPR